MVDLPSIPNNVPQVRAPESRVSPSDIAQPYQEMAQNLDKAAGVLNTASVAIAKNAGLKAVTRDADGNVQIENPPLIGDAAIAFHQAVKVAAVADGEGELKRRDIAMRQEFRDDSDGYVIAAEKYKKDTVAQYDKAAGADVGMTLGKIIDGQTTLTYRGLLNEHEKLTMQRADASIQAGITSATDDLTAMARGGVTSGQAWDAAKDKITALTQQRVNNPRLAYPPEQAQFDLDHIDSTLKANGFLYHIDQVYKDQDPEKGGARGALEQAKSILTDRSIKLSEPQREQFYHKAVSEIRANEAIRKQDIGEARASFNELTLASAAGARVEPFQVEQVASAFRSAGDPGGAARVYSSFIRKPLNDDFGRQPLSQQTQQLTALQGANAAAAAHSFFIGKGYSPEASAGIVGHLPHESGMNPAAVGDSGTSGGLAQWHNERLTALKSFAAAKGKPATDFQTQLEFIDHELHTTETGTLAKLQAAKTPEEAAHAFMDFERPQGWTPQNPQGGLGYQSRVGMARQIYNGKPGDTSMGPAGSAWLAANRSSAVDDAATAQWKTVMSDYTKEGTRPSLKTVNDIVMAARATGNAPLLDAIADGAQRMDLSGEFSRTSLPSQHATLTSMETAGAAGGLSPGSAAMMKDLQKRNAAITKGLDDNPISTTVTNFPDKMKPLPPLDFKDDQALVAGIRARGGIAQFARQNWDTGPLSALDSAEVAQVQGMLANPDPAVKGKVFNALSALPEDIRNATLAKIGGGRPDLMVSVAAGSMMKGAPDIGSSIIRGQTAIAMDKGYVPAKGSEATAFDQKFDEHIPASTFGLAARTDVSGPYAVAQGMVKARYADLSAQSADTSGKLNADRLTQAVNDVTGGVLDHNGGKLIAPVRGMPQPIFDRTMAGITDGDLAGVSTLNGEKVDANYLRNNATLESVGDGRYYVKLGKDPLKPVYAYQGAATEAPQKFMLDLRNRPLGTVAPAMAMVQP
jgi:hypothetical protein